MANAGKFVLSFLKMKGDLTHEALQLIYQIGLSGMKIALLNSTPH